MVTREWARAVGVGEVNDGGEMERAIVVGVKGDRAESRARPAASLISTMTTDSAATPAKKKLKPARKQVKPGDVEKKETPQTGKEYSAFFFLSFLDLASV
jgi:hypothetical protein